MFGQDFPVPEWCTDNEPEYAQYQYNVVEGQESGKGYERGSLEAGMAGIEDDGNT